MTAETLARARALWDAGVSSQQIAKQIGHGCTKSAISGIRYRQNWPARTSPITYTPSLGYTSEQKAKLRELWTNSGDAPDKIAEAVNVCGPAQLTAQQIRDLAKRMNLKRPRDLIHKQAVGRAYKRWGTQPRQTEKGAPIQIPLREVYQRCAELGLPRSKRGSIEALNRAIKRERPDHPGYVLSNYHPSRLTWAI